MQIKRNNRFLLYFIIMIIIGQSVLAALRLRWGGGDLVMYLVCFGPGLLMLRKDETPFFEVLPYNVGLKPGTALLLLAITFTLMPLSTALSQLGARYGGDMTSLFEQYVSRSKSSLVETVFTVALIPAVFEEMFFRGFFYAGFRRARNGRCAVLLTAALFGFFHMNLQQIAYASVLGVFIALFRELTGSMWAGMLFHFVNNAWACAQMAVPESSLFWKLPIERITFTGNAAQTAHAWAMLVLCTAISVFLIFCIARREGRTEDLKRFFPRPEGEKGKLVTTPLVLACVLLVLTTALVTLVLLLSARMPDLASSVPAAG